jgi:hypothetical protein
MARVFINRFFFPYKKYSLNSCLGWLQRTFEQCSYRSGDLWPMELVNGDMLDIHYYKNYFKEVTSVDIPGIIKVSGLVEVVSKAEKVMWRLIFAHLDPRDILAVRLACRLFNVLAQSDEVWKEIFEANFLQLDIVVAPGPHKNIICRDYKSRKCNDIKHFTVRQTVVYREPPLLFWYFRQILRIYFINNACKNAGDNNRVTRYKPLCDYKR